MNPISKSGLLENLISDLMQSEEWRKLTQMPCARTKTLLIIHFCWLNFLSCIYANIRVFNHMQKLKRFGSVCSPATAQDSLYELWWTVRLKMKTCLWFISTLNNHLDLLSLSSNQSRHVWYVWIWKSTSEIEKSLHGSNSNILLNFNSIFCSMKITILKQYYTFVGITL